MLRAVWTMENQLQEVSEGNSIGNWTRDISYDALVKDVVAFCPCPKNLPEGKLKSSGLISLVE